MNTTQPLNHPEDITKADQITAMWESLPADEYEAAKLQFFTDYKCELFGITVDTCEHEELQAIIEKHEEDLGEDWLMHCAVAPYTWQYNEPKQELWSAVCDIIDSKLMSA